MRARRLLLRTARRLGAFLNVDMESYEKKSLTLHIFQTILAEPEFRDESNVGIVIQCYLREAGQDLVALRDWAQQRGAPVWVRLVKGAYWDFETIRAKASGWPIRSVLSVRPAQGGGRLVLLRSGVNNEVQCLYRNGVRDLRYRRR